MSNQTPKLTADELAALEIIEMGWYKYLSTNARRNADALSVMNLVSWSVVTHEMTITENGIAALDTLDPNRTSKAR